MRKSILNIGGMALTAILCSGIAASSVRAEEDKPTANLSVAALSKYVWRGYEYSKDSIVLQPSMTVAYKGFSMNLWGNLDTDHHETFATSDADSSSWTETDLTLSYTLNTSLVDYGLGYIYYALDGFDDTQEVYVSATLKTLLSPSLTIYRDYDFYPGWYISAGVSHSLPITDTLSLALGAKVGYYDIDDEATLADPNDHHDAYSGFHDGSLSASMTFPVTDFLSVTPSIAYSFPLDSDAEDVIEALSANGKDSDFVYGGVTLSMSF
ncbi:MAG: hypothetical protein HY885_03290 [Deltaproteobacteria bacterium]|nr:hypothetical protein [Deltaproteobacteria bacterium]